MQNPADIFKIPELRKRILITLGILFIYRIGAAVPDFAARRVLVPFCGAGAAVRSRTTRPVANVLTPCSSKSITVW